MLAIRAAAPRWNGFTLIELMVTITILAILVMLTMPMAGDWLKNSQIRTATESLLDGLQKARYEAVRQNKPVEFVLGTGTDWIVQTAVDDELVEARKSGEGSSQVTLAVVPAGATTVTFDGMGRRWGDPATGKNLDATKSDPITRLCVDLPVSVLEKSRTRNLEIDISLSGQVRMCDPEVSDPKDTRYCSGYPTECKDI